MNCSPASLDKRRPFWAAQPDACGATEPDDCTPTGCGDPGVPLVDKFDECADPCAFPSCPPRLIGRTVATNDYVRGLALNILLTDGRKPDALCRSGSRGGHWTDAFRPKGGASGSSIRQIPVTATLQEQINLIRAYAAKDLNKLVEYGVARSVSVNATYAGRGRLNLSAEIVGPYGDTTMSIGAARIANEWVWRNS